MLDWVLDAARDAGCERLLVVVGHEADRVIEEIGSDEVTWVRQEEQLGTGHALAQVHGHVSGDETLLVLSGDVPLVSAETLNTLADEGARGWGAMAVARFDEPGSLGRVIPRGEGELARIVEASDATPEELLVQLVNAGIYALPAGSMLERLAQVQPDNAKGEIYLTDALMAAATDGESVRLVDLPDPSEALGVNDRADLARAHAAVQDRIRDRLLANGASLLAPATVTVEEGVALGADTVVHESVSLLGATRVGKRATIHRGVWLKDVIVEDDVEILPYTVAESCHIHSRCRVGPFARLRPGTEVGAGSKLGNFIEIKNAKLAEDVKVGHLSYVGDAEIGADVNIGAGVVTCNYDGVNKHKTKIGAGSFVGSDTMLVAPVEIGEKSTTGAGSVITQDVPSGALGVGRSRQRNIEGWAERIAEMKGKSTPGSDSGKKPR